MSDPREKSAEASPTIPAVASFDHILKFFNDAEAKKRSMLIQLDQICTEIRTAFDPDTEISAEREMTLKSWLTAVCKYTRDYRVIEAKRQSTGKLLLTPPQDRFHPLLLERHAQASNAQGPATLVPNTMMSNTRVRDTMVPNSMVPNSMVPNSMVPKAEEVLPQTNGTVRQGQIGNSCGVAYFYDPTSCTVKEVRYSRVDVTPENQTGAPPPVDRGRQSIVPPASAPASAVKPQMGKSCSDSVRTGDGSGAPQQNRPVDAGARTSGMATRGGGQAPPTCVPTNQLVEGRPPAKRPAVEDLSDEARRGMSLRSSDRPTMGSTESR